MRAIMQYNTCKACFVNVGVGERWVLARPDEVMMVT